MAQANISQNNCLSVRAALSDKDKMADQGELHLSLENFDTIQQRYPNKKGTRLVQAVWRDWIRSPHTHIDFFQEGVRAIQREEHNERGVDAVAEELAASVESQGVIEQFRGQIVVQAAEANETHPDCNHYKAVSRGTISDAVYIAVNRSPNNDMVQATIEYSINVAELKNPCPLDILKFVRDQANLFPSGAPPTFVEGMLKIP